MPGDAAPIATQEQSTEILELFRRQRTALLVSIPASELTFTSRLLKVQEDRLQVDQLMPAVGDQMLARGMPLSLRATFRGVDYWFKSQHLDLSVDERGFPYHTITRPARVEDNNQRVSFRIPVRLSENTACRIALAPDQVSEADLEDLSEGGACLRVRAATPALRIGSKVDFSIALGTEGEMRCQARVRYLQGLPHQGQARAGISFQELAVRELKTLRRILMRLQRSNIRTGLVG